jgi:DNA-binding IclR family transcriptional regulator
LERGLSVVRAVSDGCVTLAAITRATGCTRSTTQRLVSALVRLGWLGQDADGAYCLGPQLAALGYRAAASNSLATIARPVLERLGHETLDTVHLGVRADDDVLYLDKIAGRRGLEMRSRVGQRMALALTGVGRALMLDLPETSWRKLFDIARERAARAEVTGYAAWLERMQAYRADGCVLDLEDNEIGIRCIAAPVRDRLGDIVAAISVASATPYLPLERMEAITPQVRGAAHELSALMGWREHRA